MCGIAGFTRLHGALRRGVAARINESLITAGRTSKGFTRAAWRRCALCASKSSTSRAGTSRSPRRTAIPTIAFNGEIYNHLEIRAELEGLGHRFRSKCDTETVLRAFLQWDTACFARMRGMFAAALWVDSRHRLVLARDRMGIKPLYYYRRGDDLYFGSELKAILEHPEVPRVLDRGGAGLLSCGELRAWAAHADRGHQEGPPGSFSGMAQRQESGWNPGGL